MYNWSALPVKLDFTRKSRVLHIFKFIAYIYIYIFNIPSALKRTLPTILLIKEDRIVREPLLYAILIQGIVAYLITFHGEKRKERKLLSFESVRRIARRRSAAILGHDGSLEGNRVKEG